MFVFGRYCSSTNVQKHQPICTPSLKCKLERRLISREAIQKPLAVEGPAAAELPSTLDCLACRPAPRNTLDKRHFALEPVTVAAVALYKALYSTGLSTAFRCYETS